MIIIVQENQEETMVVAKTVTTMRCPSIPEMTQMGAQAPGRNGAARKSLSGTIPETPGSAMDVGRRAISRGTVNQPELAAEPEEEEEQLDKQENAHTVTRPAIKSPNLWYRFI